jgi:hypothetical protein
MDHPRSFELYTLFLDYPQVQETPSDPQFRMNSFAYAFCGPSTINRHRSSTRIRSEVSPTTPVLNILAGTRHPRFQLTRIGESLDNATILLREALRRLLSDQRDGHRRLTTSL